MSSLVTDPNRNRMWMSLERGKEKSAVQMFYFQPGGARYPCVCRTRTTTKHNNNNNNKLGAGIAQLVQCPIETPGAIPTQVRVPAAARDSSPRVTFTVSVQPHCAVAYI